MIKHEDERRELVDYSFPEGIKAVKLITAKRRCHLGNHYHKNKDEWFVLLSGEGEAYLEYKGNHKMVVGNMFSCPRGTRHEFFLEKGSVMLGLASEVFKAEDEHHD